MTLRVEIDHWLQSRPELTAPTSIDELRKQVDLDIISQQGIDLDSTYQDHFFVTMSDQTQIEVRAYIPYALEHSKERPALVFAHGGGWCLGSLDAWDRCCRLLAESSMQVIFSVDYRLAPEFKFPVPFTDFFSALVYVFENAKVLGVDKNRISVGGDSAGANIAAAASLFAKQHPEINIYHQLLFYPALDATMSSQSYETYAQGFGLTTATMLSCWTQYLNNESEQHDERVSPLLADSLQDMPATTIFVCEYDPVRHDGERFAIRLREAGCNVKLHLLNGMIHGAIHMTTITSVVESIFDEIQI